MVAPRKLRAGESGMGEGGPKRRVELARKGWGGMEYPRGVTLGQPTAWESMLQRWRGLRWRRVVCRG